MEQRFRHFKILVLISSIFLSSCSSVGKDDSNAHSLNKEEIAYYTKLKEDYYQQRFLNLNTNIYDARKARNEDVSEPSPFSVDIVEINALEDLTVYYSFYYSEEMSIVNFLYKDQGDMRGNGWFDASITHFIIDDNNKNIDISFSGNIYSPEVYYKGTFYYLYEAYEMGVFNLNNPNLVITRNEETKIEGYMLSTLINY